MSRACVSLLVVFGALLPAEGLQRRCTEVAAGNLDGDVDALEPIIVPPGQRRHTATIPQLNDCEQGVVLTVCDVIPPQVILEDDLSSASILRLGPTWLPLLVEVTTFCKDSPTSTTTTTTTTTTESTVHKVSPKTPTTSKNVTHSD